MKNELFDKYFGPPINMPIPIPTAIQVPIPKSEGINFIFLGGGLLILFLLYKLNSKEIEKEKKVRV
jgi:hypothetical protein|tara:strand:- start:113 stop:310 length:198 start_codon:yes stop_codon:yes gene_type:complete